MRSGVNNKKGAVPLHGARIELRETCRRKSGWSQPNSRLQRENSAMHSCIRAEDQLSRRNTIDDNPRVLQSADGLVEECV